jgi:hypothetical protein
MYACDVVVPVPVAVAVPGADKRRRGARGGGGGCVRTKSVIASHDGGAAAPRVNSRTMRSRLVSTVQTHVKGGRFSRRRSAVLIAQIRLSYRS